MKAQRGVEIEFRSYFNLGARWGWVVSTTLRLFYPRERTGTHHKHTERWMGPRAGLHGWERPPPPRFDSRTVQPVASRSADYANPAHNNDTYCQFEIMETISVTPNSKKPSNYITVWMFRQGGSVSLGSEMTRVHGDNYPRSSGNIKHLISRSNVLESMLVIKSWNKLHAP